MKIGKIPFIALSSIFLLGSCATTPMGPTVQVMPSPSKPFQVFQQDQESCKQYAQSQVAGQADAANQRAVGAAALGTALGAGVGAAVGGRHSTGVGAATGAVIGADVGTETSLNAQASIQDQYNNAYLQCMYSRGNQVPGAMPRHSRSAPPAPQYGMPPPPPQSQEMSLAEAQARLNALGYTVGKADGVMGARTRAQLKRYQKAEGLPQTGELDADTAAALSR
jgi:Putative peptidoglycan binding domain